jgi:membrane protein
MLVRLKIPLSWAEITRRTVKEFFADSALDLGAQQAYYFFFALFPALLTLLSIASFFTIANLIDEVVRTIGEFVPRDVVSILSDQIKEISNSKHGGLLTFGFLLTLWSSSGALVSIITTLNAAYDISEGRPWWKVRLTAIGLTLGMAVFILLSLVLVLVGPSVAVHVANYLYLGAAFKWTWWILQWPAVLFLVATGIGLIYYFAPDAEQDWVWITPGSLVATGLWLFVSLGFKAYLKYFDNYNETYGAIGTIIVLLTWLYLSSLAILFGAELNAEIEHASPYGKAAGEKVPGEKRRLGAAAERYFEEERTQRHVPRDSSHLPAVRADFAITPASHSKPLRPSDVLVAAISLIPLALRVGREAVKNAGPREHTDPRAA